MARSFPPAPLASSPFRNEETSSRENPQADARHRRTSVSLHASPRLASVGPGIQISTAQNAEAEASLASHLLPDILLGRPIMNDNPFDIAMLCDRHGTQMWKSHVCCTECGRIHEGATTDWSGSISVAPPAVMEKPCICGNNEFGRLCPKCFKYFLKRNERVDVSRRKAN